MDGQAACLAVCPEFTEVAPIEPDDASVERMRVEIIVEHEIDDVCAAAFTTSSRNAPLSRVRWWPRSRSLAFRRRHRNQEQDGSCCGPKRRRIVAGLKKFMDELKNGCTDQSGFDRWHRDICVGLIEAFARGGYPLQHIAFAPRPALEVALRF